MTEANDTPGTDRVATPVTSAPRWRRALVATLVVLGCLLAPIAVIGVWARNTLLDTDQYVDTVGPLASEPAIQEAIADNVTAQFVANVDVESEIADALPPRAEFVAPAVADGLERFVHEATLRVVRTDEFRAVWDRANRRAHSQVLAVLEGEGTETVETRDGKVVVNLGPVVDRVRARLSDLGVGIFDDVSGERVSREFVLFESESLRSAQGAVSLLDTLAFVLPLLTLLILAVAVALSPNRRRTVMRAALGVAFAMALLLTAFNLARGFYLDAIENAGRNRAPAAVAYDQVLGFLRLSLRTTFVLAVVVAIGVWLAGPGRLPTRIRQGVANLVRGGGDAEVTAVGRFVDAYRVPLRVAVIGLGLLLLVALSRPGPAAVLVIAVLVALGLGLIALLGRARPKPTGVRP